jgi:hypothetical protein
MMPWLLKFSRLLTHGFVASFDVLVVRQTFCDAGKKNSVTFDRGVLLPCAHGIQQLMSVRGSLYDAAAKLTHGP